MKKATASGSPYAKKRTLDQFRLSKRTKACKVCALPLAVKKQLASRDRHTVPLATVLEWLKVEHGVVITRKEFMTHGTGGHEWRSKR